MKCPLSVCSKSPIVLLQYKNTNTQIEMAVQLDLHLPFLSLDYHWKHRGEKQGLYSWRKGRKEKKPPRKRLGFLIVDLAIYWGLPMPVEQLFSGSAVSKTCQWESYEFSEYVAFDVNTKAESESAEMQLCQFSDWQVS